MSQACKAGPFAHDIVPERASGARGQSYAGVVLQARLSSFAFEGLQGPQKVVDLEFKVLN